MDRRRAAGALLALAACIACSTAAPTASNQTALELHEGPTEGCYYNFQHYGEGDRIMTNEPCLNCTCHNRMLMCYLRVCPFTKPIGQDCTIEKRADQCCPIVTCPDVPVDLLTSTSTSYPAEYGATGLGKVDKYGCSINGKYFPEGSKVPPTPNKPCEHCYCIRNMTTCVMQECTLHVDGCTPIYHKDVCCPVRYSCDHQDDEVLLLDDMTTTVRPTPGFLLTTTTMAAVTQMSQDCVHDDQIFADGALIKTEKACEHCYCMKGDIVCVVQECGTPMENEGKNCTSLPPRQGQCCPDTYICEGDELISDITASTKVEDITTLSPPRRNEGSGYRNEPDENYTDMPTIEGSGEEQGTTLDTSDIFTSPKQTPEIIDEMFAPTEESFKPSLSSIEPDKGLNTVPDDLDIITPDYHIPEKSTLAQEPITAQPTIMDNVRETETIGSETTVADYHSPTEADSFTPKDETLIVTTESVSDTEIMKVTEVSTEIERETATAHDELSTSHVYLEPTSSESSITKKQDESTKQTIDISEESETFQTKVTTTEVPKVESVYGQDDKEDKDKDTSLISNVENQSTTSASVSEKVETTSINPGENEIGEDVLPISGPGRIPGEGDCLLDGVTYKNYTSVPNINNCHSSCKCVNSIVKCDPIICSPPPEHMDNMHDCQPIYDSPDACCPTYVCNSRETIPPESHSQISGTESPKLSSQKPESECHGDQCQAQEATPISNEPCKSEDCLTNIEPHVEDCKNGICVEKIDTTLTPPFNQPEECVGDSCLSSQPTASDHICKNENGCQQPQPKPCHGHDCGAETEDTASEAGIPICQNPNGCDSILEQSKPACEGTNCDNTGLTESPEQTECKDDNCEQLVKKEHKPVTECSGPNCLKDVVKVDSTISTTQSSAPKEVSKESTTEIQSEIETHKQDAFADEHVTQGEVSVTEPLDSDITKLHDTATEIYSEPELISQPTDTTKFVDYASESFENISEEISTQSSLTHITQFGEYTTELPKKDVITAEMVTKPQKVSTNKEYAMDHEAPTEYTQILVTTESETEVSEQAYSKKQEMYTESPNTHLDEITTSDTYSQKPDITITEPSDTSSDISTKNKEEEDNIVEDDATKPAINEPTQISAFYTTEQPFEPQGTTLGEEGVTTTYDEKEEGITEKGYQSSQITNMESLTDTDKDITQSPVKLDQQDHTKEPEKYGTISDMEDTNIKQEETKTPEDSTILETPTPPSAAADKQETEAENIIFEKDLPQSDNKEHSATTVTQELSLKESNTENPNVIGTTLPEITTVDINTDSLDNLEPLKEHKDSAHDYNEISTKTPEGIIQDSTAHMDSIATEPQENVITTVGIATKNDIQTTGSTVEIEPSEEYNKHIEGTTFVPEIFSTKSDASEHSNEATENKTLQSLTTAREVETVTMGLPKEPEVLPSELPDRTTFIPESIDQNLNMESTEDSVLQVSEEQNDLNIKTTVSFDSDKTVSVSKDDDKIKDISLPDLQETHEQSLEKYKTTLPVSYVTESIGDSIKQLDIDGTTKTSTEYQTEQIENATPEITTQSQDTEKEFTIPASQYTNDAKQQTESPMSLVTEIKEHSSQPHLEEVTSESLADKTTIASHINIPGEENPPISHVTESQILLTDSHVTTVSDKEYDSKIPHQPYPDNENVHVSTSTTTVEYTNAKDSNEEETQTSPVTQESKLDTSTEFADKLTSTTKYQEDITYTSKSDYEIDNISGSTTAPHILSSSPEIVAPVTTTSEQDSNVEMHSKPTQEDEKSTEQPQYNVELTTTDGKIKEIAQTDDTTTVTDLQQQEEKDTMPLDQDEQTKLPELLTTSDIGKKEEMDNNENKPNIEEDNTLRPYQQTTEGLIYTEKPMTPKEELTGTTLQNQDSSTVKDVPIADVTEINLINKDILTTENPEIPLNEEDSRRTLSPGITIQPEQFDPESQTTSTTIKITNMPEKESVVSVNEQGDHVTPSAQTIEDEFLLQTVPSQQDQNLLAVTETDDKHITEIQDFTGKPPYGGLGDSEDIQPVTDITKEYELTEKSTIEQSLEDKTSIFKESSTESSVDAEKGTEISRPSETESSVSSETETTVLKITESPLSIITESETSAQKETEAFNPVESETEKSVIKVTEPSMSLGIETDKSVTKETELSESVTYLPKVTETSFPKESEISEENETESSLPKDIITEVTVPIETEAASMESETETSVPKETASSVPKEIVTEMSAPKETEAVMPIKSETDTSTDTETSPLIGIVTEASVPKETEVGMPMESETKTSVPDTEPSLSIDIVTEATVPKETDVSMPIESETSVTKDTEPLLPIDFITETSIPKETEAAMPTASKTETFVPKETESSTPIDIVTGASVPKETEAMPIESETESSIPKETESSLPIEIVTETFVSKETKAPTPIESETDTSVPKETESSLPVHIVTETSVPKESESSLPVDILTETSVPKESESSQPVEILTETSVPQETAASISTESETKTSILHQTESSLPIEIVTEIIIPKETGAPVSTESQTETFVQKEKESSLSEEIDTETTTPIETEINTSDLKETGSPVLIQSKTETILPTENESSLPVVTEMYTESPLLKETIPIETETEVPVGKITVPTEIDTSVPTATEISSVVETETDIVTPKETESSLTKTTEATIPKQTDVLVEETETETINELPVSTTYQPSKEQPLPPHELSPTLQPTYSSSETTPYLVELEAHTDKIDYDYSSVIPIEIYTTKTPEMYQTERGDQPLESVTDKSTQEDVLENEKSPILPHEQSSDYPATSNAQEEIPHKTEVSNEEVTVSSEHPLTVQSTSQINEVSSEQQSSTAHPMVSSTSIEFITEDLRIDTTTGKKDLPSDSEKLPEQEDIHKSTASEDELIPAITKSTTVKASEDITTPLPLQHDDKFTKPEEKPAESYPTTTNPEMSKPSVHENLPAEELPSPDFPPSGTSGYGQEPDYVEEDQAFGPGTCRYGGKVYVSAQQIPRDDPCDFCFCFRSDIICLQQSCPPPIHGCHEEPIQGFCCPRYECPVSMATTLNVTTTTTTTTTTLPPHFLPHAYKGAAQRRGCQIKGHTYKVGDVVRASSGPCLHCTCGGDGQMKCDPKACTPEPMLRQMIAAAVSAKRRR